MKKSFPLTEGKTRGYMRPYRTKSERPNRPPPAPKPKIPAKHKQFMDQMVKTYREALEKTFADPKNRGPNYHPDKLSGCIAELAIATSALTLDDKWNPAYEDYIKEIS